MGISGELATILNDFAQTMLLGHMVQRKLSEGLVLSGVHSERELAELWV